MNQGGISMKMMEIESIFKRKLFLAMMVALILMSSLGVQQAFAYTRYSCGGTCVGVLIGSTDEVSTTSKLGIGSNKTVYYQVQNSGTHGLSIGVYNNAGVLVSTAKYAAPGGNNYGYYTTPSGVDYYYLRVVCGGISQCSGDAYMEY